MKKAQVSIFIILGVVLVIGISLAITISHNSGDNNLDNLAEEHLNTARDSQVLLSYMEDCLDDLLPTAVNSVGLDSEEIEVFISDNFKSCIDSRNLSMMNVSNIEASTSVDIYEGDAVQADISFPLESSAGGNVINMNEFGYTYMLNLNKTLPMKNSSCILEDSVLIHEFEPFASVHLPSNATVRQRGGSCAPAFKLTQADSNSSLSQIPTQFIFEPYDGVFEKSVNLTLKYSDDNSDGKVDQTLIDETRLFIQYYDNKTMSWINLPTIINTSNNTCFAKISHLTNYTIGIPLTVDIVASNPLNLSRGLEPIRHTLELRDGMLHKDNIGLLVVNGENNSIIPASGIPSTMTTYDSGFIKTFEIIFLDSFNFSETKYYSVILNYEAPLINTEMSIAKSGLDTSNSFLISNGLAGYYLNHSDYGVSITHKSSGVSYSLFWDSDGNSDTPVLHTGLDLIDWISSGGEDDSSNIGRFDLHFGDITGTKLIQNNLMSSVTFFFLNATQDRAVTETTSELQSATEYIDAALTLTLFNGSDRAYVDSNINLKKTIHNHNGFLLGASRNHGSDVILGTKSDLPFPELEISENKNEGSFFSVYRSYLGPSNGPAIANVTQDDDLLEQIFDALVTLSWEDIWDVDFLLQDGDLFYDYFVVESNEEGILFYVPDYQRHILENPALAGSYNAEGDVHIPAHQFTNNGGTTAMFLAGTGLGEGWITTPVPANNYDSSVVIVPGFSFNSDFKPVYEEEVSLLSSPIEVKQIS